MATASLTLGYNSVITIDTANVGDFAASAVLGGWTTGSLTWRRSNVDSTNVDTAGWEGKEYGIRGFSLSVECLDDAQSATGDTAQDTLIDDYAAGTKRWIQIHPRVGTGYREFEFQAVINNAAWTLEQNGIVRFSLDCESDGAVTIQDQA